MFCYLKILLLYNKNLSVRMSSLSSHNIFSTNLVLLQATKSRMSSTGIFTMSAHTHPLLCLPPVKASRLCSKAVEFPGEKNKTFWETPSSLSLGAAAPNGRNLLVQETMTAAVWNSGTSCTFTVIMSNKANALFSHQSAWLFLCYHLSTMLLLCFLLF